MLYLHLFFNFVCKLYANIFTMKINLDVTIAIYFDTRKQKADGTYPVKLRVTHQRNQRLYALKLSFTEEMYQKISSNPRGEALKWKNILNAIEAKATEITNGITTFTFDEFESEMFGTKVDTTTDIFGHFQNHLQKLSDEHKYGNRECYSASLNALKKVWKKKELHFQQITPEFLNKFENELLKDGKSLNTVSIYLRCAKKLYNDAIEQGVVTKKFYPFGKSKYTVPKSQGKKRPLSKDELKLIFEYQTKPETNEDFAKDLFIFSYLCNGMNVTDILNLKRSAVETDRFHFIREKTKTTTKTNQKQIEVALHPEAKRIILKYSEPNGTYIFPTLNGLETDLERRNRVKLTTKTSNKYLKRIAQAVGIEKEVTTYFARHTFANVMLNTGASKEFLQESLGHASTKTTQEYLSGFDFDIKKQMTERLL